MNIPQDPRLKNQMKQAILQIMYGPFESRRQKALVRLIERNCVLQQSPLAMFTFKGNTYGDISTGPKVRPKLHPELHADMLALLVEGDDVYMRERPYINNYITLVLNISPSANDWLRLLPDTFQGPVRRLITTFASDAAVLTDEQVKTILDQNQPAIGLMKQRMAMNLLQT